MRTFAGLMVLACVHVASAFVVTTNRLPLTSSRRSAAASATRQDPRSVLSLRSSLEGGDRMSPSRREALGFLAGALLIPTAASGSGPESYMYKPAPLNGKVKTVVITVRDPRPPLFPR